MGQDPLISRQLIAALDGVMSIDRYRLEARIKGALRRRVPESAWARLADEVEAARARRERRTQRKPAFEYPPDLPVSARADEIAEAIRAHQVVIVAGATGSGKTTQLPKICLAAGRGSYGLIGHTQPRRIAARAVATRIAQELGTSLGEAVGYKVRFTDQTKPDAFVKVMTDGILLAETQGDRRLAAYDTLIIDEAHERSLNIDFLLGYLKGLLATRPELKVIVTSATIDAERFAAHFARVRDGMSIPAPVIEVSGRTYPVDIRYRPLVDARDEDDDEEALEDAIVNAAEELWRERPGDILVFLPGEREIRETAELLRRGMARRPYARDVEILPLYARLSAADQQRVFTPSRTGRRAVLATNVAETSLTVPGIRYVIDTGLARIKRYSLRNKTVLLQIEKIAQAAADQRAGRCGRVAEGICVRLYSEEDYAARPRYTDPEILRSSLASVILRMADLDLGAVEDFPFLERPLPRAIADGYTLLQELGAVDDARALTALGRELARLPVDPRVGRMILAGRERGCLAETLVIASALSVPDPRERPLDKQQAADQAHLRFRDERSDFLSLLALWEFFSDRLDEKLPHRRLVEACRAQFVSYLRLREWRDVHTQLGAVLSEQGWAASGPLPKEIDGPRYQTLHQALLAGLLTNIGQRGEDADGYTGPRGIRFHLHPASGLLKKQPKWVLAAELVQTTRLYARCAARIEPEWVEAVAADRVSREYFEPRWSEERGEVIASERVQLYGLTLVSRRAVSYAAIDPKAAHEVFVREALVPGALKTRGDFLASNQRLMREVAELEHKARRQDVLVDEEALAAFYAARVPETIATAKGFEQWRVQAERSNPRLLHMTREEVMRHAAANVTEELFPETLNVAGTALPLRYRFAPGHALDGLTLSVPLARLNQLDPAKLSWLVPGLVRDKVTAYLKGLSKSWRNRLMPLPDTVTEFLSEADDAVSLETALAAFVRRRVGEPVSSDAWLDIELPAHLKMNVRVVDEAGRELGMGRDLAALQAEFGQAAQLSFAAAGESFEQRGLTTWTFGELPESITTLVRGQRVIGFPTLVDEGASVAVALSDTRAAAELSLRQGVLRLMRIALRDVIGKFDRGLPGLPQAALGFGAAIPAPRLQEDVMQAVVARAFLGDDALPRNERAFNEQLKRARTRLPAVVEGAVKLLAAISSAYQSLGQRLSSASPSLGPLRAEVRAHRDALVYTGFFHATPWPQLTHLPRYLKALERRLEKFGDNPARDIGHAAQLAQWRQRYAERRDRDRKAGRMDAALEAFRWMLEELAVSLFAQELKTPFPVSYKRVAKAWSEIEHG